MMPDQPMPGAPFGGWSDNTPHCWNDHTHGPAIGEQLHGMYGDTETVTLLCHNCLTKEPT